MTASKVRTDYEQLAQMAQAFGQRAQTAQQVVSALQDTMNTLHGGDWVGKGADAFYAEMSSAVLPAMNRVVAAMNEAASTTQKISQIMKEAEADAAALFRIALTPERGSAAGTQTAGAGAPGGVDVKAASAFTRARAGSGGSGGGTPGGSAGKAGGSSSPAPAKPNWRMPPGSEAYTPAEYAAWHKRHPRAIQESVSGKQWKDEYKPDWLRARGYTFAGWRGTSFNGVEIWLNDRGDGKELLIVRGDWPTGPDAGKPAPPDTVIDPVAIHEHVVEAEDYVQDGLSEHKRLSQLAKAAFAVQDSPEYAGRVAEFRKVEKQYRENLARDIERVQKLIESHAQDRDPAIYKELKDKHETLRDMSAIFWEH